MVKNNKMQEIKFLVEKINKAADHISELEKVIQGLAFDLGKITVCKSVKQAHDLAYEAIKTQKINYEKISNRIYDPNCSYNRDIIRTYGG